VDDRLRPLWDFDDLDATEHRFAELLEADACDESRAEILTQLARVDGLRGEFAAGDGRLDEALVLASASQAVRARVELERGRLRRSSGDPDSAFPCFESAFEIAVESGQDFVAADAAHMAALAAADGDRFEHWTQRGVDLAEASEAAAYWLGPLLNNLGWHYLDDGRADLALPAFEAALEARERDPEDPGATEIARYAVGKTLRALGRAEEAITHLERAVAWAERSGAADGWFHEELASRRGARSRCSRRRTRLS
jgi:tetratricopeptide (TPR) repeat protein